MDLEFPALSQSLVFKFGSMLDREKVNPVFVEQNKITEKTLKLQKEKKEKNKRGEGLA